MLKKKCMVIQRHRSILCTAIDYNLNINYKPPNILHYMPYTPCICLMLGVYASCLVYMPHSSSVCLVASL